MNLKIKSLVTILAISLAFYACDDMIPEPKVSEPDEEPNGNDEVDSVSFSGQLVPIFDNNCASCHGASLAPNFSDDVYNNLINGYVVPGEPDESVLFQKIDDQSDNHYDRVTNSEREAIRNWIEQGALDN